MARIQRPGPGAGARGAAPLLERVRFVSISETNLDEFFMIRVAGLQQQVASDLPNPVPDGMTPEEQLSRIHDRTGASCRAAAHTERGDLPRARGGRHPRRRTRSSRRQKRGSAREVRPEMLPILTPLAIDPAHPFPHISNLSLNLLVVIEDEGRNVMARVKVPNTMTAAPARREPRRPRAPGGQARQDRGGHSGQSRRALPGQGGGGELRLPGDAQRGLRHRGGRGLGPASGHRGRDRGRWFGHSVRLCVTEAMPEGCASGWPGTSR